MAGSDGTAVVPTTASLRFGLENGALGNLATAVGGAATVGVDSTTLTGTGATVQAVLEELDNLLDTTVTTAAAAAVAATVATENAVNLSYRPAYSHLAAKSADVNSSTVVVASGLSITLPIAGTYEVKAVLPYITAAAADLKFQFLAGTATITATVGVSDLYITNGPSGDATVAALPVLLPTSWTTAYTLATTGAPAGANPVVIEGILVATVAGTVTISFAQGTSDGSNTSISPGAHLVARRVA